MKLIVCPHWRIQNDVHRIPQNGTVIGETINGANRHVALTKGMPVYADTGREIRQFVHAVGFPVKTRIARKVIPGGAFVYTKVRSPHRSWQD